MRGDQIRPSDDRMTLVDARSQPRTSQNARNEGMLRRAAAAMVARHARLTRGHMDADPLISAEASNLRRKSRPRLGPEKRYRSGMRVGGSNAATASFAGDGRKGHRDADGCARPGHQTADASWTIPRRALTERLAVDLALFGRPSRVQLLPPELYRTPTRAAPERSSAGPSGLSSTTPYFAISGRRVPTGPGLECSRAQLAAQTSASCALAINVSASRYHGSLAG